MNFWIKEKNSWLRDRDKALKSGISESSGENKNAAFLITLRAGTAGRLHFRQFLAWSGNLLQELQITLQFTCNGKNYMVEWA
jgi:hypothetical protein